MSDDPKSLHTVEPGDRLSRIASVRGYASAAVIWDHPANAELKKRRANPELLMPGDRVFLPPKAPDVFDAAEKKETKFEVGTIPSEVRVKLVFDGRPIKGKVRVFIATEPYTAAAPYEGYVSLSDGVAKFYVDPRVTEVDLSCDDPVFSMRLRVGHLQPIDDPSGIGVEQRLDNLGYYCPPLPGNKNDGAEGGPRKLGQRAQYALARFQADASAAEVAEIDDATLDLLVEKSAT